MSRDKPMAEVGPKQNEDAAISDSELNEDDTTVTRKRKKSKPSTVISQMTLRKPEWAYIHLRLISPSSLVAHAAGNSTLTPVDEVTVYMHIQSALKSFLGVHGTAITLDFLRVKGHDIWIRTPRQDVNALVAAVGGWIGSSGEALRIMDWGSWGPNEGRNGKELFND
ncbi:hypothetical protein K461DRAFT_291104 [Myriangium duriaei CBS 260.36]|uniref:Ribonucleases P/MRP subunit Pop8-like domain-containing protein n=1 Tax=Myriangium duriaei CBS 260.36 TaxID=1168546 RepID=A0A9P4J692_9PEZI|nr:hypothetical protein K461DRAFT_291104 [Myriangium duriaei CBS 260.36]